MTNKKSHDFLDKIIQIYFSNFTNKMTITPIETNANPRRYYDHIADINRDSDSNRNLSSDIVSILPTSTTLVFVKNETSDIKINPTIKARIPNPSTIFFLFIRPSLRNNQIPHINHFGGYQ